MFPPLVASSAAAVLRAPPLCYAFSAPHSRVEPRAQLSASLPAAPRTRLASCSLLGPVRYAMPGGPQIGFGSRAHTQDWRPVKKSVSAHLGCMLCGEPSVCAKFGGSAAHVGIFDSPDMVQMWRQGADIVAPNHVWRAASSVELRRVL